MEKPPKLFDFVDGLVFGAFIMFWIMAACVLIFDVQKQDAIKHGAAYYHPETREFTWKTCSESEQLPSLSIYDDDSRSWKTIQGTNQ